MHIEDIFESYCTVHITYNICHNSYSAYLTALIEKICYPST